MIYYGSNTNMPYPSAFIPLKSLANPDEIFPLRDPIIEMNRHNQLVEERFTFGTKTRAKDTAKIYNFWVDCKVRTIMINSLVLFINSRMQHSIFLVTIHFLMALIHFMMMTMESATKSLSVE